VVYSLTCCIKLSVETDITLRALLNAINGPSLETGLITRSDLVRDFIEDGVAAAWSRLADGTYDLAESNAPVENNSEEQANGL